MKRRGEKEVTIEYQRRSKNEVLAITRRPGKEPVRTIIETFPSDFSPVVSNSNGRGPKKGE